MRTTTADKEAMYFRFAAAVVLVVLVTVAGIGIEKRCLMLRRALCREHYRYEVLRDLYARQRLQIQQLGAPSRLLESLERDRTEAIAGKPPAMSRPRLASGHDADARE